MTILLTDRRGIFYEQQGRGELQIIHVSPSNQRQILRDLQGNETRQEVATRAGLSEQVPLWRYANGQVVLYGTLGRNISERVQAAKVWLAEDFAPKDCNVFYFIFGKAWVLHGVKEDDDEGHSHWRVTAIAQKGQEEIIRLVRNSLNDQMLLAEENRPCIAVHNDPEMMEALNRELEEVGQKAVSFAALRPAPNTRPLYAQRNNTLIYFTLLFVMLLAMLAAILYTFVGMLEKRSLNNRLEELRQQIAQIEINEKIGYIREPEPVLHVIKTTFNQQPSAIMDGAARFGALFGELENVSFAMPTTDDNALQQVNALEEGQYMVQVRTSSVDKKLLVAQETMTKELIEHMPWLRMVENVSSIGDSGLSLNLTMQVEASDLTRSAADQQEEAQ